MSYWTKKQLACGSKEFYPPFPFPQGESRGGDGSPHAGTRLVPAIRAVTIREPAPPARGISKRSDEILLERSPCGARGRSHFPKHLPECSRYSKTIIWSWVWFRWPVLKWVFRIFGAGYGEAPPELLGCGRTRLRSNAKPLRPYICLFRNLMRCTCPST
jgi:hypothetical protein